MRGGEDPSVAALGGRLDAQRGNWHRIGVRLLSRVGLGQSFQDRTTMMCHRERLSLSSTTHDATSSSEADRTPRGFSSHDTAVNTVDRACKEGAHRRGPWPCLATLRVPCNAPHTSLQTQYSSKADTSHTYILMPVSVN